MSGTLQVGGVTLATHTESPSTLTLDSGLVFPAGHVLQVVQGNYSTTTTSSSSTFADTGLSASITPSSSSNKILVLVNQGKCRKNDSTQLGLKLFRGATEVLAYQFLLDTNDLTRQETIITFSYFDSPATTSSLTYKTQFNSGQSTSSVVVQNGNSTAFIVLMEIAA